MVISGYVANHAVAPPLALRGARCEIAAEYTKKKNVIRLTLSDQSEYLFMTHDPTEMNQWQSKIQFHAGMIRRQFQIGCYNYGWANSSFKKFNSLKEF